MNTERQLQTAIHAPNDENRRALETGVEQSFEKLATASTENLSSTLSRTLMGQASGAGSLEAVCQAALRCVQDELSVTRAALLLFDAARTMRFVAWSGLSEEYRTAVDGHSPWSPDETNATPLLVSDVEQYAALAAYMQVLRREGIRSLAFVPLQCGPKLLGKFMLYYREPHAFSDGEIATARQIADLIAFALEHHRISAALDIRLGVERELRQHAENEAAERQASESRLHLALEAGRMGAWDWDIASGRVSWSKELESIHGLEPGAFGGTLHAFQRDVHPADVERLQSAIAAALEAPEADYSLEYRIVREDGTCRWLAARGRVLVDSEGRPIRMVGICCDTTDRKLAEDAVREADRRKDDFLATLAHELRNPLAQLRAGAAVIRMSSGDPGIVVEHCTIMERQLQQVARLVDDLLDLSDLTHRGLRLEKRRIELGAVARTAVEQSRILIEQAGHELSVRLPEEHTFLEADPLRLGQVLSNLLSNAVKYTPRGGQIELVAERDGAGVRISVRDSGLGIPPNKLDAIFEMFAQLDRSLETGYKGLGIGLSLVKTLVQMHGGTIEAHSDGLGKGSVFSVWLPVTLETARSWSASMSHEVAPGVRDTASCRVLLVDDNRDLVRSMARLIRILGHDIRVAFDGPEAIHIGSEFKPDVVLMDIGLPKLNGYEAARAIRSTPWGEKMTLVAVTGWGREIDMRRSHESGFDRHLTKPVEPDVLEALLNSSSRRCE
jgi:PAS domain S-box-containing protein